MVAREGAAWVPMQFTYHLSLSRAPPKRVINEMESKLSTDVSGNTDRVETDVGLSVTSRCSAKKLTMRPAGYSDEIGRAPQRLAS